MPMSEGFAARVPVGDRSFVFFRTPLKGRRTAFLGYQSFDECTIGEFTRKGEVVPWMRLEPPGVS